NITEGWFEDGSGRVKVMWFNQPYMASYVAEKSSVRITGTVGGKAEKPYIANPEVERIAPGAGQSGMFTREDAADAASGAALMPVYPESRGVTSRWFY